MVEHAIDWDDRDPDLELEKAIKFFVDTGSSYRLVVKEAVGRGFEEETVQQKLTEMIDSKVLARGPLHGSKDVVVVRAWSPNAAAMIDEYWYTSPPPRIP
jgi:hypothetical protein